MAVSGIDIEKVLEGAKDAGTALASQNISENPSYQYERLETFYMKMEVH